MQVAEALAAELRPASRAYHEIWLDGEKQVSTEAEEPFYRDRYLPRKFKVAVGLSTDNCVDIWSQDVGLLAIVQDGRIQGFNLLVGGGLGMTHNKGDTTARLAQPLGFVPTEHGVEAVRLVAAIFRDHGNRSDRRHARLKYLLAEWGIQRFREEFQRRASFTLGPAVALPPLPFHDHLGRHRQSDGRWFYGVFIQSGRIVDTGGPRAQDGAPRDRHPPPAGDPAHRPAEPAADRSRRGRHRDSGADPSGARRHACRPGSRPRGGSRWPAPRSRPAAWRSPSRSARSRRSSTSSRPSSRASASATRRSPSG